MVLSLRAVSEINTGRGQKKKLFRNVFILLIRNVFSGLRERVVVMTTILPRQKRLLGMGTPKDDRMAPTVTKKLYIASYSVPQWGVVETPFVGAPAPATKSSSTQSHP